MAATGHTLNLADEILIGKAPAKCRVFPILAGVAHAMVEQMNFGFHWKTIDFSLNCNTG